MGPNLTLTLLWNPRKGASLIELVALEEAFARILGRGVDLVTYGGLDPTLDQDILRDTVLV